MLFRSIAPVRAVFGNTDPRDHRGLVDALDLEFDGVRVHVSHGHEVRRPSPEMLAATYAADVIVYGHTHVQRIDAVGGRLVVNPGAAGAQRGDLEPCVAHLVIGDGPPRVRLIPLGAD